MKRSRIIPVVSLMISLWGAKVHAGSCADHLRVNLIANVQTDGADVLMRAESLNFGNNSAGTSFSVGGYTKANFPANAAFRLAGTQNADYRKNTMSILLAAKMAKEPLIIQVSYISPGVFQLEKVSEGSNARGLECGGFE